MILIMMILFFTISACQHYTSIQVVRKVNATSAEVIFAKVFSNTRFFIIIILSWLPKHCVLRSIQPHCLHIVPYMGQNSLCVWLVETGLILMTIRKPDIALGLGLAYQISSGECKNVLRPDNFNELTG